MGHLLGGEHFRPGQQEGLPWKEWRGERSWNCSKKTPGIFRLLEDREENLAYHGFSFIKKSPFIKECFTVPVKVVKNFKNDPEPTICNGIHKTLCEMKCQSSHSSNTRFFDPYVAR